MGIESVTGFEAAQPRTATSEEAGRNCPYCRFAFKQGVSLLVCPSCHAPHHEECWADNGGCSIVGCPSAAPATATATASAPAVAAPPPAGVAPTAAASLPAPRRGVWSPLALVALGALIAGAGAAGAYALTRDRDSASSSTEPVARATAAASATTPATEPTAAPEPTPSPAEDRRAVVATLHEYEDAYSSHDIAGLRAVLAPGATRHGLRATGCSDTTGREAVLDTYREQFALGTGAYTLEGLSPGAVSISGARARVALGYSIAPGGTGSVSFRLRRGADRWRITRVIASC